jgi:hypothetical protein
VVVAALEPMVQQVHQDYLLVVQVLLRVQEQLQHQVPQMVLLDYQVHQELLQPLDYQELQLHQVNQELQLHQVSQELQVKQEHQELLPHRVWMVMVQGEHQQHQVQQGLVVLQVP